MTTRSVTCGMLLLLLAMLLPACTPPVTTPIGTVDFTPAGKARHETLLVFLPGIWDSAAVFVDEGFIAAAEARGSEADMMGVEAHIGYYKEKKLLQRLREDVVVPARQAGYRHIWLIGISLGGFGALWYDIENPGDLDGVVALSPYLGERETVDEVAQAGGMGAWQPSPNMATDEQHRIWMRLKAYLRAEKSVGRLYLGYGRHDKFAKADGLLAAVMPPNQVLTVEGGHDWPTWRVLWHDVLQCFPPGRRTPGTPP